MAQKKNPKTHARKEVKAPVESKNGKKTEGGGGGVGIGGGPKHSMFTWFVVLALLGVWSSVAVVYFDIVDYDSVIARAKEFRVNFSEVLQGLTRDGDGSETAESLEEVLDILAEEGSDWFYGFFTFLFDVVASPVERGKEEEEEREEEGQAAAQKEGGTTSIGDMVEEVILDLQNQ